MAAAPLHFRSVYEEDLDNLLVKVTPDKTKLELHTKTTHFFRSRLRDCHFRAESNSHLLRFLFTNLHVGLKNSRYFLNQSKVKAKQRAHTLRALSQIHVFTSQNFDWSTGLFVS